MAMSLEAAQATVTKELSARGEFPSSSYRRFIGALGEASIIRFTGLQVVPGLLQSPDTSAANAHLEPPHELPTVDPERSQTLRNALIRVWEAGNSGLVVPVELALSTDVAMSPEQAARLVELAKDGQPLLDVRLFEPTEALRRRLGGLQLTTIAQIGLPDLLTGGVLPAMYVEYQENALGVPTDGYFHPGVVDDTSLSIQGVADEVRQYAMSHQDSMEILTQMAGPQASA